MKPIKMLGLAALAALMALAFVGVSSAMAEETELCSNDAEEEHHNPCVPVPHVHESTLSGAKGTLLTNVITVACDVLFLGETLGAGEPEVIHGNFTYSNCSSGCEVTEESEDSLVEVLGTAHELAEVTLENEVRVHCGFFINCVYSGEGLSGHGLGPLLSSESNGSVIISEQVLNKIGGFCPETAKLDINTTPLKETYVKRMRCSGKIPGLYLSPGNYKKCVDDDIPPNYGSWELKWV